MKYYPMSCIWEITMGCNMRCGHCGSSCKEPLEGELTTEEALELCDDIIALGVKWITLSGGEPLTRKDWALIAKKLSDAQLGVYLITNAWEMNEEVVSKAKECKLQQISISIDGTKEIHDSIRKPGAYERCEKAFAMLKKAGVDAGAVTTVTKRNLDILPEIRDDLTRLGAKTWQLQIGIPMGNLSEHPDWLIEPEDIKKIIDIAYEETLNNGLETVLADCIGYYTRKETIVRRRLNKPTYTFPVWDGCNAGIHTFGILHNGDVVGCTSLRNNMYVEGNVKERSLGEIWDDPGAFSWNRKARTDLLEGYCKNCIYVLKCKGGCSNVRLSFNNSMHSENKYCMYNLYMNKNSGD